MIKMVMLNGVHAGLMLNEVGIIKPEMFCRILRSSIKV